ncbi:NADH:flavin oxidoreductase/NADH oxidase [Ceratobasidium sp. AG-Ba]|nr:NADH:flavin oxidoreductase/NADH oxidase [Ceratobasidium sp. AG-Ba]
MATTPTEHLLISTVAPSHPNLYSLEEGYYPPNNPSIGTPLSKDDYPQNKTIPKLFQPLKIRDLIFKNRIWVSPMCQYSAIDGHMTDWHLVHLGSLAVRGAGSVMLEATAVVPEGRITPGCAGIWSDTHIEPMRRIVNFVHGQGAMVGIQLSHAGRKSSVLQPWLLAQRTAASGDKGTSAVATAAEGGWEADVLGPSAIPFLNTYPTPREMNRDDIKNLIKAYIEAVERCKNIGFDFIELHAGHGYLLHSFYSPISNKRTDEYGGSLENRLRLTLEIASAIRATWEESKPLFVRISANDWAEWPEKNEQGQWAGWGIEQTVELSKKLGAIGVDLIDTSSGGNWVQQKIPVGPLYQVPFAERVKKEVPNVLVGTVGLITTPQQAEEILEDGQADVVLLARELLRHGDFPIYAAQELGLAVKPANQYERAWTRMMKPQK